jgi:two-component system response regulator MtrA
MAEYLGRLMIVDDDVLMQRALKRAAYQAGLDTLAVLDGCLAVETALLERPDLILLDVKMPNADGRDILAALKGDDRTSYIPVFMHSGCATLEDRQVAFALGADDFFEKGYDPTLLARRILDTIEKASSGTYQVRRGVGKVGEGSK